MEIITSAPPRSEKSQNKRKKTIKWVFISLSLTHTAWGVLYKNRTEMRIALLYRGAGAHIQRGKCPSPSYKLDTIFLCRGQTTLAMRLMFAYPMKKVF